MDNLPIGPLLGVLALLTLWSGLLTAVEIAHYRLKFRQNPSRPAAAALPQPAFELNSLILGNTLIKVLITVILTLLALNQWFYHGATVAWLGTTALLLIFVELIPRRLAARYPAGVVLLGNGVLRLPMKLLWPLTWLFNCIARSLLRPFLPREAAPGTPQDEDEPTPKSHHDGVMDHHPGRAHPDRFLDDQLTREQRRAHHAVEAFGLDRVVVGPEPPGVCRKRHVIALPAIAHERRHEPAVGIGHVARKERPDMLAADPRAGFDHADIDVGPLLPQRKRDQPAREPAADDRHVACDGCRHAPALTD